MSKPVLAVGLLAVTAAAWYWASPPRVAPVPVSARVPAVRQVDSGVPAVRLDRLATREPSLEPPAAARDPFRRSRAATAAQPGDARRAARVSAAAPASASPPAWPRLELIGVAEGREGTGLVRTAILAGPDGVHHVRPGDVVSQVYRVERIAGDGVEVRLLPEERVVRLPLRP